MLKTEKITINEKEYIRTWSDQWLMIERDGERYEEAIDPADSGRTYTETDVPCEPVDADDADYEAALFERYGVEVSE
jgi:hypothetical protein